jgi:hypothetical protein
MNIDIVLPRMPCSILSLDIQDIMGSHVVNVEGSLYKTRISKYGKEISAKQTLPVSKPDVYHPEEGDMSNYEFIKKQVTDEEGCIVYGDVFVKKVPGNFHISSHAFGHIVSRLAQEGLYTWDVSHKINHFYVGETSEIEKIKREFGGGVLSPLDKIEKRDMDKKVYEYYLKVIYLLNDNY